MWKYFDLSDGPLQIQKKTTFVFEGDHQKGGNISTFHFLYIFLGDFYSLLSVRCYFTYL